MPQRIFLQVWVRKPMTGWCDKYPSFSLMLISNAGIYLTLSLDDHYVRSLPLCESLVLLCCLGTHPKRRSRWHKLLSQLLRRCLFRSSRFVVIRRGYRLLSENPARFWRKFSQTVLPLSGEPLTWNIRNKRLVFLTTRSLKTNSAKKSFIDCYFTGCVRALHGQFLLR